MNKIFPAIIIGAALLLAVAARAGPLGLRGAPDLMKSFPLPSWVRLVDHKGVPCPLLPVVRLWAYLLRAPS